MNRNRTPRVHQNDHRRIDYDREGQSSQRGRIDRRPDSSRQPVHRRFESYMPLTIEKAHILNVITDEHYLRRPNPITHSPNMDKTRYCSFHKDYGHTMEDCHKLKDEIEFHVRRGMLKEYVQQSRSKRRWDTGASGSKSLGKQPITGVIHMITGATEEWSKSKNKRKQHLRSVMTVEGSSKKAKDDEN